MKKIVLVALLLIAFYMLSIQNEIKAYYNNTIFTEEEIETGISDTFRIPMFNAGVRVILRPDYTFSYSESSFGCLGGYYIKRVDGEYVRDGKKMHLSPKTLIYQVSSEHFFDDKEDSLYAIPYFESDSTSIPLEGYLIRLGNSTMFVFNCQNSTNEIYGLPNSNILSLANLYNSKTYYSQGTDILINRYEGKLDINDLDIEGEIPKIHQHLFLKEPITGEIEKLDKIFNAEDNYYFSRFTVKIDNPDKLRVGMYLFPEDMSDYPIVVSEIHGNYCIAINSFLGGSSNMNVGQKVSTTHNNSD